MARYSTLGLPPCSAVSVKESACRSCHASSVPATRLIAVFTMGSGRLGDAGARARSSVNNDARPEEDDGPDASVATIAPPPRPTLDAAAIVGSAADGATDSTILFSRE